MANFHLAGAARLAVIVAAGAWLSACVTPKYSTQGGTTSPVTAGGQKIGKPYQVGGVWYVPRDQPNYDERGVASWYGEAFHLRPTANGETFDMFRPSAAHTTLPLPSMVEVTNLDNGRKMVVRVNDRGPFVNNRIIDLSQEAARQLGYERAGLANVRVRYLGPAPLPGSETLRYAQAKPLPTRPSPMAPRGANDDDDVMLLAAGAVGRPVATPSPLMVPTRPAAPRPVAVEPLPPVTGSEISSAPIGSPTPVPTSAPIAAGPSTLRIQAGAFSSQMNAEQAAARLGAAGQASIEPLERNGATLYRVMLPAPGDEDAAFALRDRIAAFGFEDARVVRTF